MAKRPDHIIPLTEDHYTALGRVAAEWSALEGYISAAIAILLGCRWRAAKTVTANMPPITQADLLKALARLQWGENDAVTLKLVEMIDALGTDKNGPDGKKVLSVRTRRNIVIHGSWILPEDAENPIVMSYKARGRYKAHAQPYTAKEIDALADEIGGLTGAFMELLAEPLEAFHFGTPRGLLSKSPPPNKRNG